MGKRPERPGKDMKLTFMVPWSKSKVTQKRKSISLKPPIAILAGDKARQADVQVHGLRQPA